MATSGSELEDKDKRIVRFIRNSPGGFVGTAEVAEELGMTTNGASYRLKELKKDGVIDSRQPSRDEVWYIAASREHWHKATQTATAAAGILVGFTLFVGAIITGNPAAALSLGITAGVLFGAVGVLAWINRVADQ